MSGRSFLDTNVLIYTDDHDAPEKQRRAIEVYERARRRRTGVISTQVLQEYFVGATRKLGVEAAVARRKVELFARLDLVRIDLGTILAAIDFQRLHRVSFWDTLMSRRPSRAAARPCSARTCSTAAGSAGWRSSTRSCSGAAAPDLPRPHVIGPAARSATARPPLDRAAASG